MKRKYILKTIIGIISLLFSMQLTQAAPGYQTIEIEVAHRDNPLQFHIWYPSKQDGDMKMLGENAVFTGVEVSVGATSQSKKFPLVLLSHGSGGNAQNISWIAYSLVNRGMIVVSTNHPGSTSGNSIALETLKIWQRSADFTSILDYMQKAPTIDLQPDFNRIGAVGFSLGGYTVLGLAGAQVKKQKYIEYCEQFPNMLDCRWFNFAGVNLSQIDASKFEQSNLDERIKAIVVIDPALSKAFTSKSLIEIKLPSLIINLGSKGEVPVGLDGKRIATIIKNSNYVNIKQATHFSFLGVCTAMGEDIIKQESEEPICSETGKRKRDDIHAEIKILVGEFLKNNL